MSQEIRAQSSLIPDPAVRGYLSRLATKLIGSNLLLTLDVLDEDQSLAHEPVWLPGGYMFVSRALIRTARDESEFAGMFAHALAHEISHDSTRMTTVSPGTIPLIVSGGWSAVGPSAARSQQRPLELQADALAVRIIAAAGYDPEALTRYLARLQPSDTERIDAIEKAIQTLPPQNSTILDSSEFQYIQEKIARKPGPKPSLFR